MASTAIFTPMHWRARGIGLEGAKQDSEDHGYTLMREMDGDLWESRRASANATLDLVDELQSAGYVIRRVRDSATLEVEYSILLPEETAGPVSHKPGFFSRLRLKHASR